MAALIAFLIIISIVLVPVLGVSYAMGSIQPHQIAQKHFNALSPVAKQLVKEYKSLPVESRPVENIIPLVRSLDETTRDPLKRDRHFDKNWLNAAKYQNGPYHFTWDTRYGCRHDSCNYSEYGKLHNLIQDVHDSIVAKELAVIESNNSSTKDMAKELEAGLRREIELNKEFVREFKAL